MLPEFARSLNWAKTAKTKVPIWPTFSSTVWMMCLRRSGAWRVVRLCHGLKVAVFYSLLVHLHSISEWSINKFKLYIQWPRWRISMQVLYFRLVIGSICMISSMSCHDFCLEVTLTLPKPDFFTVWETGDRLAAGEAEAERSVQAFWWRFFAIDKLYPKCSMYGLFMMKHGHTQGEM